jgi:hypothetical protein
MPSHAVRLTLSGLLRSFNGCVSGVPLPCKGSVSNSSEAEMKFSKETAAAVCAVYPSLICQAACAQHMSAARACLLSTMNLVPAAAR